jgi:ribosome maturation factor RimP
MSTTQHDRLRELLAPLVTEHGLELEELEASAVGRKRILRIVVDSDQGVDLDECAAVSRAVSERLDETNAMGDGAYDLEVTSPGAERPLREQRHFERERGRLMRARLTKDAGGEELVARILAVDADGLDLEVQGIKGRKPKPRRLEFREIEKARVEVEFNRKADKADNDEQDAQDQQEEEA